MDQSPAYGWRQVKKKNSIQAKLPTAASSVFFFLCRRVLHPPVDGRSSPVAGQQGGVVDDGAVLRVVDHLHGDELGAEGQDVELGARGGVLSHHFWDGLALDAPARELEDGNAVLLRLGGLKTRSDFLKNVSQCQKEYLLFENAQKCNSMVIEIFAV